MSRSAWKTTVRRAFADWCATHGYSRKTLTANIATDDDLGLRVVELQQSNFGADYYVRFGLWLGRPFRARIVREPECQIRVPVEGPWGGQPAIRECDVTEEELRVLLERYVQPLVDRTATRNGLDAIRSEGKLARALIRLDAYDVLGWPPP